MAGKQSSAGILLHRAGNHGREVLLVHPGGPFWARKDLGAWSIPKGELDDGEEPRACARREFAEETGTVLPEGELDELGAVRLKSGKVVVAFAAEGDLDPAALVSNTFELEWPPRSKQMQTFPEIDRAEFFSLADARVKILDGQRPFLDGATEIVRRLAAD